MSKKKYTAFIETDRTEEREETREKERREERKLLRSRSHLTAFH